MSIFSFITSIFKPAADLVDALHTSEGERLAIKAQLLEIQTNFISKSLDYERSLVEAQRDVVVAEAKSESWVTRNWRPLSALTFVGMAVYGYVAGVPLPEDLWTVIKIMIGGYVGSRGLEKIVPTAIDALKAKER